MKIDHIAIWTANLEGMKDFYVQHFDCQAGPPYANPAKRFTSYFLRFESGARLEIMKKDSISARTGDQEYIGYAHVAISVGSEESVRRFTEKLRAARVPIVGEPRWTGDGCFESVAKDPDGNTVEITM
jgi:lactoylglutathione lyase